MSRVRLVHRDVVMVVCVMIAPGQRVRVELLRLMVDAGAPWQTVRLERHVTIFVTVHVLCRLLVCLMLLLMVMLVDLLEVLLTEELEGRLGCRMGAGAPWQHDAVVRVVRIGGGFVGRSRPVRGAVGRGTVL